MSSLAAMRLIAALILMLAGIGLILAAEWTWRPGQAKVRRAVRFGLVLLGCLCIVGALVAAFTLLLGIFFGVAAGIVFLMALVTRRTGRRYVLLSTLAVAAERKMPLARAIEAFAEENGGMLGRSARRAAKLIRAGCPVSQALEQAGDLVPREALAAIRVGCETGSLAPALREAVDAQQSFEPVWYQVLGKLLYFWFLLTVMVAVGSFMMLRIAPALEKIFADFDQKLPAITRSVGVAGGFFAAGGYLLLLVLPPLIVVLLLAVIGRYVGWFGFELPGAGPLMRRFDTAPLLRTLALGADRGVPLRGLIATLATGHPRPSVRARLARVGRDMDAGADWAKSLAAHGLIRQAERAVLEAAQRVGNLPWALREMAASSQRRLLYRVHGLSQVLFVVVIVSFGLLVMTFVVAYFLPLVELIHTCTGWSR